MCPFCFATARADADAAAEVPVQPDDLVYSNFLPSAGWLHTMQSTPAPSQVTRELGRARALDACALFHVWLCLPGFCVRVRGCVALSLGTEGAVLRQYYGEGPLADVQPRRLGEKQHSSRFVACFVRAPALDKHVEVEA